MRRPVLAALTWAVGVAACTAVAWSAVRTLAADVIDHRQPVLSASDVLSALEARPLAPSSTISMDVPAEVVPPMAELTDAPASIDTSPVPEVSSDPVDSSNAMTRSSNELLLAAAATQTTDAPVPTVAVTSSGRTTTTVPKAKSTVATMPPSTTKDSVPSTSSGAATKSTKSAKPAGRQSSSGPPTGGSTTTTPGAAPASVGTSSSTTIAAVTSTVTTRSSSTTGWTSTELTSGGSVAARCTSADSIALVAATPSAGHRVEVVSSTAERIVIRFDRRGFALEVRGECSHGRVEFETED